MVLKDPAGGRCGVTLRRRRRRRGASRKTIPPARDAPPATTPSDCFCTWPSELSQLICNGASGRTITRVQNNTPATNRIVPALLRMFVRSDEVIENLFAMSVGGRSNTIARRRFPSCQAITQNPAQNLDCRTRAKKRQKRSSTCKGLMLISRQLSVDH